MTTPDPGHTTHGGDGRFLRTLDTVERDAAAARLRAHGHTFASIAEDLGFADRSAARKAVQRCLDDTVAEPAHELRALELRGLDEMTSVAWDVIHGTHHIISGGKIIRDGYGTPVVDHAPRLAAVDRLLKVSERRARLLGLDAPVQVAAWTDDAIDAEIVAMKALVEQQEREVDASDAEEAVRDAAAQIVNRHLPD